jgi:hypothetical protein
VKLGFLAFIRKLECLHSFHLVGRKQLYAYIKSEVFTVTECTEAFLDDSYIDTIFRDSLHLHHQSLMMEANYLSQELSLVFSTSHAAALPSKPNNIPYLSDIRQGFF